ncbi:uncharacterized protein [Anabrus simplex]|uniref:uncharacterized protein isoform X2 n=1 Tax=Anabrus simplex TaxID=316456 RepID=UPI0035A2D1F5
MKVKTCFYPSIKLGVLLLISSCCGREVTHVGVQKSNIAEVTTGPFDGENRTRKLESSQHNHTQLLTMRDDNSQNNMQRNTSTPSQTTRPDLHSHHNRNNNRRRGGKSRQRGKGRNRNKDKTNSNDLHRNHNHFIRNLEKQALVRNRTLELLGGHLNNILGANINKMQTSTEAIMSSYSNTTVELIDKFNSSLKEVNIISVGSQKHGMVEFLDPGRNYQYDYEFGTLPGLNPSDMNSGFLQDNVKDSSVSNGLTYAEEANSLDESLKSAIVNVVSLLNDKEIESTPMDDPCERWMECKDKLQRAFLNSPDALPSCPCQYPSSIFYDDKIWDKNQKKHFRWKDVSGAAERLDVYKPGAKFCIRSLLAQGSSSLASQHCCYDRFNTVRPPNNDNKCAENPQDEEFHKQVESSKYY